MTYYVQALNNKDRARNEKSEQAVRSKFRKSVTKRFLIAWVAGKIG